jgi:hypothetical protein
MQGTHEERTEISEQIIQNPDQCIGTVFRFYKSHKSTINSLIEMMEACGVDHGSDMHNLAVKIPRIVQNMKLYKNTIFEEWYKKFKTVSSVIHSSEEYEDLLEKTSLYQANSYKRKERKKMR